MKMTLVSRQKLGFAMGDIIKPVVESKDREAWETCNGLVLSSTLVTDRKSYILYFNQGYPLNFGNIV